VRPRETAAAVSVAARSTASCAPPERSSRRSWYLIPAAFCAAFIACLAVGLLQGVRPFYADAEGYWALASTFTDTGHFSLLSFVSLQRGYFLPLVIYVLKMFTAGVFQEESTAATVFDVLLFALIGAVLAPRLAEIAWPEQSWGFLRRIGLTALLLIFWSGDLNYPLTDFPGLAMGLLALVAVARTDSPGWMLLAGAAAGATLNLRPAYLPLLFMLGVIVGLNWFDQRGSPHPTTARRVLCAGLLIVGFALVSLPQSLSAHRYFNTWSPVPGAGDHLSEEVLALGMTAQRWDSYERPVGVPNAIIYPYPSGKRLLDQQPEQKIKGLSQYLGIVASHPTIMVPLFIRHLINGLDVRYSTIYVENRASGGHIWLRVSGFLLVFLALVRLLWPAARRSLGRVRWRYPIALSLACVTSLTSVMEPRYMLPVEILVYVLVLAPGWPSPIGPPEAGWRRFRTSAILALAGVAFTAFIWHTLNGITSYLAHPL
jgi:hypothetical protein